MSQQSNKEKYLHEQHYIANRLRKEYPQLPIEQALVEAAYEVKNSDNSKQQAEFYNLILSEGDTALAEYDKQVCDWLANNLTEQNLAKVNALRGFYGLKIELVEAKKVDMNHVAAVRMQFDGGYSRCKDDNEFFEVQYSEAFRDYLGRDILDNYVKHDKKEYNEFLEKSAAVKKLLEFGYDDMVRQLPSILRDAGVNPEEAIQFNICDLQYLCIEHREETAVYDKDGKYLFTRNFIKFKDSNVEHMDVSAKRQFWKDIANNNPELVESISQNLAAHEVQNIDKFWANARKSGNPYFKDCEVSTELHHDPAIMNGGENDPSKIKITVKYKNGFSAHQLLHRHDTPKDNILHQETGKTVRFRTVFIDDSDNSKVLWFGGLRKEDRGVGNLKGMTNVPDLIKQELAERKEIMIANGMIVNQRRENIK